MAFIRPFLISRLLLRLLLFFQNGMGFFVQLNLLQVLWDILYNIKQPVFADRTQTKSDSRSSMGRRYTAVLIIK